jgi:rod shape-determining protein MreC
VTPDPDRDSFIDVIVKPAAHLDSLDEVLVITSTEPRFPVEQQQDMATSEALKGAEADAIKAQKKASEIMAERLPGLTEPHPTTTTPASGQTPGNAQPGPDQATPATAAEPQIPKLLHPQHPDRFTPGAASVKSKPAPKSGAKPGPSVNPAPAHSGRNPQP